MTSAVLNPQLIVILFYFQLYHLQWAVYTVRTIKPSWCFQTDALKGCFKKKLSDPLLNNQFQLIKP